MNGTMKLLLAKYQPEKLLQEEQPEMAVLPRLKPYKPGPIITPSDKQKLDVLEQEKQKLSAMQEKQAETKAQLSEVGQKIKALQKKLGIGKRSPEAEAAYQSNLPMFRRLGVLG